MFIYPVENYIDHSFRFSEVNGQQLDSCDLTDLQLCVLALMREFISVQGLTTEDAKEQAMLLRQLLATQCGTGLMHESVHVSSPEV